MPLAFGDVTPTALTLMITPHDAVCNSTPGRLLTVSLTSPVAWELLEGGDLGLVHLCVPLGAKSRVGVPERCLEFSGEGWPFDTDDTPAVGLLPFPLALGSGRQKRGPSRAAGTEAPSRRGSSLPQACPRSSETRPSSRHCSPWPQLHPPGPLGREQAGLFSLTALEPHP